ncbi:MAG: hypothetical protein JWQ87_4227 [Candidatus Sulfotelmatobacter sp.]|nr:hypothetical protein [Candidatus Sulfotelmatobacter sp.]
MGLGLCFRLSVVLGVDSLSLADGYWRRPHKLARASHIGSDLRNEGPSGDARNPRHLTEPVGQFSVRLHQLADPPAIREAEADSDRSCGNHVRTSPITPVWPVCACASPAWPATRPLPLVGRLPFRNRTEGLGGHLARYTGNLHIGQFQQR